MPVRKSIINTPKIIYITIILLEFLLFFKFIIVCKKDGIIITNTLSNDQYVFFVPNLYMCDIYALAIYKNKDTIYPVFFIFMLYPFP